MALHYIRALGRLLAAAVVVVAAVVVPSAPAYAQDVGTVDFSYAGVTAPTGDKPQSKLWVADGIWWGSLWDTQSRDYHIFRFDWLADRWTDTGVLIDERSSAYTDTLWDGTHLYVATAGKNAGTGSHSPRIVRFSYDSAIKTWSRDPGFPVTVGSGGAEAVVIAKDSTGLLWLTYTQGSKVWLTHSIPGNDGAWVPKYQLPTPGNEANVSPDDISAIVAYDGDKIGVLWSNQVTQIMYWAWHQDGADDLAWTLEIAYQQPEGADDHIALRSLVGDENGRVFAATKTSMDHPNDPNFNVLVLTQGGQWESHVFGTQADDHTRAILMIDQEHKQLYVFATAPCCSGGPIYYKKAPLDNINFTPGLGDVFISIAAHPETNNVTSTKQNVDSSTGLLVESGDDDTRFYVHNKLDLGGTPPAEPPETTITQAPPSVTTSHDATFEFTSSEPGTFLCRLDNGAEEGCSSPRQYVGLANGTHTFTVTAVDTDGMLDPSPATHTWQISDALFSDDFSSGEFTSGGWVVSTGGGGAATVEDGAVFSGNLGARLVSSTATGSTASIKKTLVAGQPSLTIEMDVRVVSARTDQFYAWLKLYDSSGSRRLTLARNGSNGVLSVDHSGASFATSSAVPLNQAVHVIVFVAQGSSGDTVEINIDGVTVYTSTSANLGDLDFKTIRLGDDSLRRQLDHRADNVVVRP